MTQIIPSNERYHADHGWLDTHWHFSFGDYYDRKNMNWGALRVFNDDIIRGGGGFDFHPHQNMEIITVVCKGALRHQDSLGNQGVIHPGEVQVMSAGRGIMHSEFNDSETQDLHLLQIWIMPRTKASEPRWEQKQFSASDRKGKLQPVVSSGNIAGTLAIDQDAQIYLSTLSAGQSVSHTPAEDRKGYLFVVDGSIELNGRKLGRGDQARLDEETKLEIIAAEGAELILLDLP